MPAACCWRGLSKAARSISRRGIFGESRTDEPEEHGAPELGGIRFIGVGARPAKRLDAELAGRMGPGPQLRGAQRRGAVDHLPQSLARLTQLRPDGFGQVRALQLTLL